MSQTEPSERANWRLATFAPVALLVILSGALIWPASTVQPRYRVVDFFPDDAPERADFDALERSFGRDDRTALLVLELAPAEPETTSAEDRWAALEDLTAAVETLPNVEQVLSPTRVALLDTREAGPPRLREARHLPWALAQPQLEKPPLVGQLMSADARVMVIGAVLREDALDFDARRNLRDALLALPIPDGMTAHLAGYPVHRVALTELVQSEARRLYPVVLLAIALVLLLVLRSIAGVLLTVAVAALAGLWTTGAMALLNLPPNILSPGVYILVAVLGVADAVHLLVRRSPRELAVPCGIATLTTALGFGSLWFTHIPMIAHFGAQVAVGVLAAFVLTFLLVPPFLPRLRPMTVRLPIPMWGLTHRRAVLGVAAVILLTSALLATRVRVTSPLLADLDREHPIRQTYELLDHHLGGVIPVDVIIDVSGDALYHGDTMRRVEALATRLRQIDGILSVTSPSDVLRRLEPLLRKRPDADVLSLLPTAMLLAQDQIRPWVDDSAHRMRIRLRLANLDTEDTFAVFARIDAAHQEVFEASARLTGQGFVGQTVNRSLVDHFARGALIALGLVFLLVLIALRRLGDAARAVLPNLIPILVVLGVMGAAGLDLRYTSAVVLTVVFAVAVDDTVHFLTVARGDPERGLRLAGPGILLTSLVLATGFGVLLFSAFLPNRVMGLLFVVTALSAVLADLLVLPASMRRPHDERA